MRITNGPEKPTAWVGWFHGEARPSDPGRKAIAYVLKAPDGEQFESVRLAGWGTTPQAEYEALIALLEFAVEKEAATVVVRCDSSLIMGQMSGVWEVNPPNLRLLHRRAKLLIHRFPFIRLVAGHRDRDRAAALLARKFQDEENAREETRGGEHLTKISAKLTDIFRPRNNSPDTELPNGQ